MEERAAVCLGLQKEGWTMGQAEAATGLEWVFDGELGDSVRIVELRLDTHSAGLVVAVCL